MFSLSIIGFLILTYLLSSIPFGLVISKIFGKIDIREFGSKNIGATNVTRILGKKYGLLTLILDSLKGAIMVLIAKFTFAESSHIEHLLASVGFIAVIGHIFPIYLKFKGGKGVATTIAVICAVNPFFGLANIITWVLIFFATKISAVSSLLSIMFIALFAIYDRAPMEQILLFSSLFVLIVFRHKENIMRIKKGNENKVL